MIDGSLSRETTPDSSGTPPFLPLHRPLQGEVSCWGGASTVVQKSNDAALRFASRIGVSETLQTALPYVAPWAREACSPCALSCPKSETHPAQQNPIVHFGTFSPFRCDFLPICTVALRSSNSRAILTWCFERTEPKHYLCFAKSSCIAALFRTRLANLSRYARSCDNERTNRIDMHVANACAPRAVAIMAISLGWEFKATAQQTAEDAFPMRRSAKKALHSLGITGKMSLCVYPTRWRLNNNGIPYLHPHLV